jgi:hypothetical protein
MRDAIDWVSRSRLPSIAGASRPRRARRNQGGVKGEQ